MSIAVTTRSYDNTRAGANTQESILTPAAVSRRGVKRLFTLALPGDARGCEAQPLIVPGVLFADGSRHDVVYLATMANQVFAFDANTGARLWLAQLGMPIKSTQSIDPHLINDHWGILSTPVIDLQAGLLYACAWKSPDGTVQSARYFLHALRLSDGSDAHTPLNLEAVTYYPGHGRPVQYFRSSEQQQRAALLLLDGTVFIAFGTNAASAAPARGWLIGIDTAKFQVSATWTATAAGSGGSIWHSGGGPAADADGNIYVLTGNGDFDALTDFGESLVKLRYQRPGANGIASLRVTDWWTPWTDRVRSGGRAQSESMFGSAGPVLAPTIGAVLASNADGILYTANMQQLGRTQPADLEPANAARNYGKLKAPPIFYSYYPGSQSPAPANPTGLNFLAANRTHQLHGTPVLWKSDQHGLVHFCWGENENLRAWSLAHSGESTYLGCGAEVASAEARVPPGGMPGGMISLSANGDHDGVIWASIPYDDANLAVSAGRFLAYDATTLDKYADGSGALRLLWDSESWNWRFSHNKFNRPVVWNGRVFLPTYDGEVWVLGLV